jgi:hypothetical protein
MRLPSWFKTIFCKKISREIPPNEQFIARCILAPMHFKKEMLDPYCFIPPRKRTDVSLIRLMYCNPDCAKKDGLNISKQISSEKKQITFKGLALINNSIMDKIGSIDGVSAKIKGTPINDKNEYVASDRHTYKCDPGKPFHADLIYNEPVPDGEPATKHRKIAENILNQVNTFNSYFEDTCNEDQRWCNVNLLNFIKKQSF